MMSSERAWLIGTVGLIGEDIGRPYVRGVMHTVVLENGTVLRLPSSSRQFLYGFFFYTAPRLVDARFEFDAESGLCKLPYPILVRLFNLHWVPDGPKLRPHALVLPYDFSRRVGLQSLGRRY